jgi:hypothetical protein
MSSQQISESLLPSQPVLPGWLTQNSALLWQAAQQSQLIGSHQPEVLPFTSYFEITLEANTSPEKYVFKPHLDPCFMKRLALVSSAVMKSCRVTMTPIPMDAQVVMRWVPADDADSWDHDMLRQANYSTIMHFSSKVTVPQVQQLDLPLPAGLISHSLKGRGLGLDSPALLISIRRLNNGSIPSGVFGVQFVADVEVAGRGNWN